MGGLWVNEEGREASYYYGCSPRFLLVYSIIPDSDPQTPPTALAPPAASMATPSRPTPVKACPLQCSAPAGWSAPARFRRSDLCHLQAQYALNQRLALCHRQCFAGDSDLAGTEERRPFQVVEHQVTRQRVFHSVQEFCYEFERLWEPELSELNKRMLIERLQPISSEC